METFFIWLSFEVLVVVGSLIFVQSFGQSLSPLQQLITSGDGRPHNLASDMRAMSTDELGVLTQEYRKLLEELDVHNEILDFNNQILRSTVSASDISETVNAILPICQQAIKDDIVFLLIYDRRAKEFIGVAKSDKPYSFDGYVRVPMNEEGIACWVFEHSEDSAH